MHSNVKTFKRRHIYRTTFPLTSAAISLTRLEITYFQTFLLHVDCCTCFSSLMTMSSFNAPAYSLFSAPFSRASSSTDQVGGLHGLLPSLQKTSPSKQALLGSPFFSSKNASILALGTPKCISKLFQLPPTCLLT